MKQKSATDPKPEAFQRFCPAGCTSCTVSDNGFPSRFSEVSIKKEAILHKISGEMSRVLFVMRGSLQINYLNRNPLFLSAGQCLLLAETEEAEITSPDGAKIILLEFIWRVTLCNRDVLVGLRSNADIDAVRNLSPILTINPLIEKCLIQLFQSTCLVGCPCYHGLKQTELFMMMKMLYSPMELVHFFYPIIRVRDDFKAFVLSNHHKVKTTVELAALAGMSLSVFKQKFRKAFDDTIAHWMMKQKAEAIRHAVRNGIDDIQTLMEQYGFDNMNRFTRFCRTYLGGTPTEAIARIKEDKSAI